MNKIRPHITCHMMCTIDGKITSADQIDILSDDYFDLYTRTEDKLEKQAWMLGRVTMQMFASKGKTQLLTVNADKSDNNFIAPYEGKMCMFGVDTKGILRWDKNTIKLSNIETPLHLVIVVTSETPKVYLSYLKEKEISYIIAGKTKIDFELLFKIIKEKFGVERLLLEGGGILNGFIMSANLVDEISLLITPVVVNQSEAPSVFEGKQNFHDLKHFTLISAEKVEKNCIWLRYKKSSDL